jgi:hypothetical protein
MGDKAARTHTLDHDEITLLAPARARFRDVDAITGDETSAPQA